MLTFRKRHSRQQQNGREPTGVGGTDGPGSARLSQLFEFAPVKRSDNLSKNPFFQRGYSLLFSAIQYPGTETYFGLNTLKIDELCVFGLEKVVTYGDMVICSVRTLNTLGYWLFSLHRR